LERGAGGARRITSSKRSAGKTLSHLLATDLCLRAATGSPTGGGKRSHAGVFALLLERRDFDTVRKEKGRLRSYLLTSLKHFLTNERNRAMAIKRGAGQRLISLDQLHQGERAGFEPADTATADQIYERRWAMTVLNQVLARLEEEYRAAGKMQLFDRLQKAFTDEPDRSSQVEIAHELGMTENAVYQAFHRFRQRYRELLREEVAHTVAVAVDIEDELRHLIAVLRA
jgi:hypothetical protein